MRRLFTELIVTSDPEGDTAQSIREDAAGHRGEIESAAGRAGSADAPFVADVLFLTLRGFYLASIEDPERWSSERSAPVVDRLLDVLLAATGAPSAPAPTAVASASAPTR
jgi:hypothetical protein